MIFCFLNLVKTQATVQSEGILPYQSIVGRRGRGSIVAVSTDQLFDGVVEEQKLRYSAAWRHSH